MLQLEISILYTNHSVAEAHYCWGERFTSANVDILKVSSVKGLTLVRLPQTSGKVPVSLLARKLKSFNCNRHDCVNTACNFCNKWELTAENTELHQLDGTAVLPSASALDMPSVICKLRTTERYSVSFDTGSTYIESCRMCI